MSWTYNDWITQTTPAAQLTRINLHIVEVTSKITADLSAHGYSRQNHPLNDYLDKLFEQRGPLLSAGGVAGGVSLAVLSDVDC